MHNHEPMPLRMLAWLAFCATIAWLGLHWRELIAISPDSSSTPTQHHPVVELLKLIIAFLLGRMITDAHRITSHHVTSVALEQAQILLCVSGAVMMIIIGDSLPRAFGIAGAASLIRFRTPVDDPKDTIILFLSLGMGMACGLGAFSVAALGAAFLSVALLVLDRTITAENRRNTLVLSVSGPDNGNWDSVAKDTLARCNVRFETRGIQRDDNGERISYLVEMNGHHSVEDMTRALELAGLRSVSWDVAKKKKLIR